MEVANAQTHAMTGELETSYADFLERLLLSEDRARNERRRQALLQLSGLPAVKAVEQYDFKFASGAPRSQILELAGLAFIERKENVVLLSRQALAKHTWPVLWPIEQSWPASPPSSSPPPT